jgi:trk system potassium uptake protein TrkA
MKQFVIIGLGNFGYYLAKQLYDKGHDVLAIDKNNHRVQQIKDNVTQAVVADATDPKTIESILIKEMDAAVVCIGSDLSASILVTLNLKDIGVKRVFAKSVTESHGRILHKVGALEVFFPEKDTAISLAERLHNPNILDYLPFLEGYTIIELVPPKGFVGKSLKELNLINRYGVQVLAIKRIIPNQLNMIPTGEYVLKEGDMMILLGPNEKLDLLREKEK